MTPGLYFPVASAKQLPLWAAVFLPTLPLLTGVHTCFLLASESLISSLLSVACLPLSPRNHSLQALPNHLGTGQLFAVYLFSCDSRSRSSWPSQLNSLYASSLPQRSTGQVWLEFSQENIEEPGKGTLGTMAGRCQGWACGGLCPVCFSASLEGDRSE